VRGVFFLKATPAAKYFRLRFCAFAGGLITHAILVFMLLALQLTYFLNLRLPPAWERDM